MGASDDLPSSVRHDNPDDTGPIDESTDHRGLRVLGLEECLELLRSTPVGRVAFVSEGEPVVFPVNHGLDGLDVIFRTSWGSKLEAAETSDTVAFEIDGFDSEGESGWSVLVKGTARLVYESVDTDRYDALHVRSWPDIEGLGFWVRIRATEITGREVVAATG